MNIAIYRSSSIGDVVLATASLSLLEAMPFKKKIFWLGKDPSLTLIAQAYPEVEAISVSEKGDPIQLIQEKTTHLDVIIDLQKTLRSRRLCARLAQKFSAASYSWNSHSLERLFLVGRARLLGRAVSREDILLPKQRKFEQMLQPLRMAIEKKYPSLSRDLIGADYRPKLRTSTVGADLPWLKEMRLGKWLAVAPGASYEEKRAPLELFSEILRTLQPKIDLGLVFLGDNNDRRICSQLMNQLSWPYAQLNLAGKLSLWETALALGQSQILVSNDTSLAHMAEAMAVPAAVLFGPTVEAFGFAPHLSASRSFSVNLGCRPCSKHGKTACRYQDRLCFTSIRAKEVADYLERYVAHVVS